MDSLNALILLYKELPLAFAGRSVSIHVLDLETEGPHFAAAALSALQAEGGPLQGLGATLSVLPYNWADPLALEALLRSLPADAIVALSSEGGLFDYGSDADISANLKVLAQHGPPDCVLAASISRPDETQGPFQRQGIAKVQLRSLESFGALAAQAGWALGPSLSRPINFVVGLRIAEF
jgi:hypothetical protein